MAFRLIGGVACACLLSAAVAYGQSGSRSNPFAPVQPKRVAKARRDRAAAGGTDSYYGRRAWTLQNQAMKVIVTPGGGHIASLTLNSGAAKNLNPLWLPPWKSAEPNNWQQTGRFPAPPDPAGPLLSTILGHNICVDFFGAPSKPEADAGVPAHGEAPCVNWTALEKSATKLTYRAELPKAQMRVTRTLSLPANASTVWITETVENLSAFDRPFGWQQHPTFGPPFLEAGASYFDMPATQSVVYPKKFSDGMRLKQGEEFEWPNAPGANGEMIDLRDWPKGSKSSDYTASIIDPSLKWGWFTVINVKRGLLCGYVWPRADFPWVGNWEENRFRSAKPWLGKAVTRGMEFGTTPFPDSRRDAVTLSKLFETPTYRWISARAKQTISYAAFLAPIPAGTTGVKSVVVEGNAIKIALEGVEKTISLAIKR